MARAPLARGVVAGGELREPDAARDRAEDPVSKEQAPEELRAPRDLERPDRRPHVRDHRESRTEKQLANAVRFRAQETLPIPLDEAVLDYRILDDRVGEDGVRVCRVLLVVAHRELVERYVAACRKAGLKLSASISRRSALLRALPTRPSRPLTTLPSSASRSATIARPSPSRTDVTASSRACSRGGAPISTRRWPGPRPDAVCRRADEARARAGSRGRRRRGSTLRRPTTRAPAILASFGTFARELVGFTALLPGTAELPRHRRDPDHRRSDRPRRARGRARAADRHSGPRRRSAHARPGCRASFEVEAVGSLAAGRRSRDRGLDACRQPSSSRAEAHPQAPSAVFQLALLSPFVVAGAARRRLPARELERQRAARRRCRRCGRARLAAGAAARSRR